MPTGNLPSSGKKLWEKVYNDAKAAGDSEEKAAKKAWGAVENAGWHKDKDGKWVKSSLTEFSLRIEKAVYDKTTNERRWRAVASDTDEDSRQDSMSLELFSDFLGRIQTGEKVPKEFQSEFWSGGMPYLSVSHYPDFNGDGVPGDVEAVYVDGSYLKAKGKFYDTPLGRKCFEAVCSDLYGTKSEIPDKVRISIAFLDWAHMHKASQFVFERKDENALCPECLSEILLGGGEGKVFLKGHLVHLAMTRVPVNKRTDMEVDKSMADIKTRKDDAASIVGDELAEELEEKAKLVGKSEALVIRSEEDNTVAVEEAQTVTCPECGEKVVPTPEGTCPKCGADIVPDAEEEEGCVGKKKEKKSEAVAEESEIKQEGGTLDKETIDQLISTIRSAISEEIQIVVKPIEPNPHPLDGAFNTFRAAYDGLATINDEQQRLQAIQEPFNALGQAIVESIKPSVKKAEPEPAPVAETGDLATVLSKAIADALQPVAQRLDLVSAQLQSRTDERVPARRSISPSTVPQETISIKKSETPKLRAVIERTTL